MRKSVVALSIAMLSMFAPKVWADGTGLTVNGVMTLYGAGNTPLRPTVGAANYLDAVNGYVPAGYGNSAPGATAVVIGSGVEFGFNDGSDFLTINFTGSTVTLTDVCVGAFCGFQPVTIAMYSPYITGYSMMSDSFPNAVAGFGNTGYFPGPAASFTFFGDTAAGFTGGTIVASYTSIAPPPTTSARTFAALASTSLSDPSDPPDPPDPVPEPATIGLMAVGLVGLAGLVRKRFA